MNREDNAASSANMAEILAFRMDQDKDKAIHPHQKGDDNSPSSDDKADAMEGPWVSRENEEAVPIENNENNEAEHRVNTGASRITRDDEGAVSLVIKDNDAILPNENNAEVNEVSPVYQEHENADHLPNKDNDAAVAHIIKAEDLGSSGTKEKDEGTDPGVNKAYYAAYSASRLNKEDEGAMSMEDDDDHPLANTTEENTAACMDHISLVDKEYDSLRSNANAEENAASHVNLERQDSAPLVNSEDGSGPSLNKTEELVPSHINRDAEAVISSDENPVPRLGKADGSGTLHVKKAEEDAVPNVKVGDDGKITGLTMAHDRKASHMAEKVPSHSIAKEEKDVAPCSLEQLPPMDLPVHPFWTRDIIGNVSILFTNPF